MNIRDELINDAEILRKNRYLTLTNPTKFAQYITIFAGDLDSLKEVVEEAIFIRDNLLTYEQWIQLKLK
jgi:hypothetical protein